jgi:hypothetical protein
MISCVRSWNILRLHDCSLSEIRNKKLLCTIVGEQKSDKETLLYYVRGI